MGRCGQCLRIRTARKGFGIQTAGPSCEPNCCLMKSSAWRGIATLPIGIALGLVFSVPLVFQPDPIPQTALSADVPTLAPSPAPVADPPTPEPTQAAATSKPVTIDGSRIAVPRLGIDLPLELGEIARDVPRDGYAGATPENVAFIFPSSRMPGEGGNTYIYAHARVGMFLALWGAKLGDEIVIYRADGGDHRSYRVALIAPRVSPTDAHWLDASGDERVTLQTSTGPNPGDPRFIVVAYPEAAPAQTAGRP
jgi:sortase (surface protein transpeptidase)